MGKILQDLWIMTNTGIVLYDRVYNPKINEQLFGALMSAINQFAEQVAEGGISSFELSDKKFVIRKEKDILFVANAGIKNKEKKIQKALEDISDKFFDTYSDKLEKWDSDISIFSDFEVEIEDNLVDTIDKFKKAFW